MILGIGADIVEISRIEKAVNDNPKFLSRVFTDKEIQYLKSKAFKSESLAGNFAAKEAISKALGTGFRGFSFKDIEVLRDALGKPEVILYKEAHSIAASKGEYKVHISISHNRENAIAYAILEVI